MKFITTLLSSLSLVVLFSCALTGAVHAEKSTDIYKWTDKDGRIHYAARPGDSTAKKMHLGSRTFHKTNVPDQDADAKKESERTKLCQDSKDTLTKYKKAPFLNRYDQVLKQKVRLTEAETKDAFLQAEKDISYWCNPPKETKDEPEDVKK